MINENKRTEFIRLSLEIAKGADEVQALKLVANVANTICLHATERLGLVIPLVYRIIYAGTEHWPRQSSSSFRKPRVYPWTLPPHARVLAI